MPTPMCHSIERVCTSVQRVVRNRPDLRSLGALKEEDQNLAAFVRKKRSRGGEYYQLVESYRVEGKPRQRVLVHLGSYPTVDDALREWPKEIENLAL